MAITTTTTTMKEIEMEREVFAVQSQQVIQLTDGESLPEELHIC